MLRILFVPWLSCALAAATTSGVINQDETWSGRILLTGDVTVPTNVTLTLLPGTRVECAPGFDDRLGGVDATKIELIIAGGSFTAVGTAEEPIVITSAATVPNRSHWYGVRATSAMVTLNHCELRYAYIGLDVKGGPSPLIGNSRFFYSYIGTRLDLSGQTVNLENCTWDFNTHAGIEPSGTTGLRLVSSVLHKNNSGIRDPRFAEIIDCTISDNNWGTSRFLVSGGEIVVRDSRFVRNRQALMATTAWITNSVFASNTVSAVEGETGVMVNCTVVDNALGAQDGIAVAGRFDLYHCEIAGNNNGASGVPQSGPPQLLRSISDCAIKANLGFGAKCETIVDSIVEGNGDVGLWAIRATNCIVRNNGYGVFLSVSPTWLSPSASSMTGCLVESNQSWGVAGIYHAFEVEGSSVVGNGGSGIELDKYEDSRIRGNRIAGNGEAGIRFSFALQPGTVTGNIIQSNRVGLLAVFPGQSLSDTGISSNIISENLEYEISNLSSGVIIADGNYWGEPTTTELTGAVANLTKIHDSHDAPASAGQVLIRSWNDSPVGGGPVVIVQGLEDQTVDSGAEVGWTVVVEGAGELVYQWFKDGFAIGDNGDTLQLGPVAMEDAGVYSVVVGNSFVSASSSARLTVAGENAPPPPVLDLASFAGLTIYGTPGQSYQVQYGTDAGTPVWVPLTNITLSTTHYFFVDRESAGPGKRFYRVVELPDSSP